MRVCVFTLYLIGSISLANAQKYKSDFSIVSFFSDATVEDIKAENSKAVSLFNSATGDIAFSISISDFEFEKSLMQEHFNEKYMESDKYPKASFQGVLGGFDLASEGEQKVTATGKLTIHGVTKEVSIPGVFISKKNQLETSATFMIQLADYKVKIPQLMWQNIAEAVEVTIRFRYKAL